MKSLCWMMLSSAAVLAHPSVSWWGTEDCFSSPENTANTCSEAQQRGFDWSQLADEEAREIPGFQVNGFAPKRDCRSSGGKCIEGRLSPGDHSALRIGAQEAPFSARNFHMTTSRPADVMLAYTMPDGSMCHQVVPSSPSGTDVVNDQCGGAKSVDFRLASPDQKDVDLELHRMDFDCSPGPKTPGSFGPPFYSPSMFDVPIDTPENAPGIHSPIQSSSSATSSPLATTSPMPESPTDCPDVVPKCLNTWLSIPQCDSNSDTSCFCPSPEFTAMFRSCVEAWSSSQEECDSALSYFAGMCAPHVPSNPDIISLVPTCTDPVPIVTETPCTTITWSSITATVPQLCFSTSTGVSTTSVILVPGTPTPTTTSCPPTFWPPMPPITPFPSCDCDTTTSTPPGSTPPVSTPPTSSPPVSTPPTSSPPVSTPPASSPPVSRPYQQELEVSYIAISSAIAVTTPRSSTPTVTPTVTLTPLIATTQSAAPPIWSVWVANWFSQHPRGPMSSTAVQPTGASSFHTVPSPTKPSTGRAWPSATPSTPAAAPEPTDKVALSNRGSNTRAGSVLLAVAVACFVLLLQ